MIDAPDMNVVDGIASVQGYGSIVDGSYTSATGSHSAAGNQGDILDPRAVADGTLDEFDTTVLFAPATTLPSRPSPTPRKAVSLQAIAGSALGNAQRGIWVLNSPLGAWSCRIGLQRPTRRVDSGSECLPPPALSCGLRQLRQPWAHCTSPSAAPSPLLAWSLRQPAGR